MLMTILLFVAGLSLSAISAIYSVLGLLSIFPAAPYTIGLMAGSLEVSKLVIASWLYRSWSNIPALLRVYFTAALLVLMFLTSMACFGFLSKAHSDSSVITGDATSALLVVDEKIATHKENIRQARMTLGQMDAQVNELLSRTVDDKGASKAVTIRKQQRAEREVLNKEIQAAQAAIGKLQIERAPLASSVRKVEAEVGPIRYIAALIYSDKVDDSILEKAVRIVILMIVFVFDPLAVLLLIAANWNMKHHAATTKFVPISNVMQNVVPPKYDDDSSEAILEPTVEPPIVDESAPAVESKPEQGDSLLSSVLAVMNKQGEQKSLLDALDEIKAEVKQDEDNHEKVNSTDLLHNEEATRTTSLADVLADTSDTSSVHKTRAEADDQTITIGNTVRVDDSLSVSLNDDPHLLYIK